MASPLAGHARIPFGFRLKRFPARSRKSSRDSLDHHPSIIAGVASLLGFPGMAGVAGGLARILIIIVLIGSALIG
jgi:hypothetical protein